MGEACLVFPASQRLRPLGLVASGSVRPLSELEGTLGEQSEGSPPHLPIDMVPFSPLGSII